MIQELYQKAKNTLQQLVLATTVFASAACAQAPLEHNRQREDIPSQLSRCSNAQFITRGYASLEDKYQTVQQLPVGGASVSAPAISQEWTAHASQYGLISRDLKKDITDAIVKGEDYWKYAGEPKRNTLGDVPSRTHSGMPPKPQDPLAPYEAAAAAVIGVIGLTLAAYLALRKREPPSDQEVFDVLKAKYGGEAAGRMIFSQQRGAPSEFARELLLRRITEERQAPAQPGPGAQHQEVYVAPAPVYKPCKPKCQ